MFFDAVPRTSFMEPPPVQPTLGVYGVLSALERLGHAGADLETHVRNSAIVYQEERADVLRVLLMCVRRQVHDFVDDRGVWPSHVLGRARDGPMPLTRVVTVADFIDFLGWWCGEYAPDGASVVLNINMQDGWMGPPGYDPWFETVCALLRGCEYVHLLPACANCAPMLSGGCG